jgi:hypothetical protein
MVLKFSKQFVKYDAIELSTKVNVSNIATAERNNPVMGGFQQVRSCRMLS